MQPGKFLINKRLNGPWLHKPSAIKHCIWLHGASLGECKVLVNVAKRLQGDLNEIQILITTQKAEIIEVLQKLSGEKIQVAIAPVPLDFAVKKFYDQVKPKALILCENELWPAYLKIAAQKNINVALISGRFKNAAPWARLDAIKFATFQTESDKERFEHFKNAPRTNSKQYCNWKLLSASKSEACTSVQKISIATRNTNKNFEAGFLSVHFSEWHAVQNLLDSYSQAGKKILLAPRRLDEAPLFENAIGKLGASENITILKKFGVLQEYIPQCKFAVMGGSFVKRPGIHNFLEPLSLGVPTFVGPFANGETEFVKKLLEKKILTRIPNGAKKLPSPLANPEQITTFLKEETNKVERSYAALVEKLQQWIKL